MDCVIASFGVLLSVAAGIALADDSHFSEAAKARQAHKYLTTPLLKRILLWTKYHE